ncbi:hypothetical protein ACFL42_04195 [Candidatus Omnitrophota bacterium]
MRRSLIYATLLCVCLLSIAGCAENRGGFIGDEYVNKITKIRLVPPAGWKVEEKQDLLHYFVNITSPVKDALIDIRKQKVPQPPDATLPDKAIVTAFKNGLLKSARGSASIESEGEIVFNDGRPAYAVVITGQAMDGKSIILLRDGALYIISYIVSKNNAYKDNVGLIEESLGTLDFNA